MLDKAKVSRIRKDSFEEVLEVYTAFGERVLHGPAVAAGLTAAYFLAIMGQDLNDALEESFADD